MLREVILQPQGLTTSCLNNSHHITMETTICYQIIKTKWTLPLQEHSKISSSNNKVQRLSMVVLTLDNISDLTTINSSLSHLPKVQTSHGRLARDSVNLDNTFLLLQTIINSKWNRTTMRWERILLTLTWMINPSTIITIIMTFQSIVIIIWLHLTLVLIIILINS